MKMASFVFGVLGFLLVLLAVFGRFHHEPTVTILDVPFAASSVLLGANTLLLIAILLGQWKLPEKKS
ncbi:MAG: hypothetical protein N3B01_07005 [Verrucomicrobiae bacterium]|nr:hypothetical protein [Verrucomicrobiae bacterium]